MIIYLSTKSSLETSHVWGAFDFEGKDKLGHLVMYTVLTFLLLNAVSFRQKHNNRWVLVIILSFGILLGMLLEGIQGYFLVDRNFELLDIIANISGSFLGYILYSVINKKS